MTDWVQKQMERIHGEQDQKGGPGSGHYGHAGRPGKRGGSVPGNVAVSIRTGRTAAERQQEAAGGSVAGGRSSARKHKISNADAEVFIGLEAQAAEQEVKGNYRVDIWKQGHAGASAVYRLHDLRRLDSAGIPKTVFEGSKEQAQSQLEKRIQAAVTRAKTDARDRINSFHEDIEMGFYDDIPEAAATERVKILGWTTL